MRLKGTHLGKGSIKQTIIDDMYVLFKILNFFIPKFQTDNGMEQ